MNIDKQNFLSVDGKTARSSYGDFFTVGETVGHQDESAGVATIISFEVDVESNEVKTILDKGYAYLDFLVKKSEAFTTLNPQVSDYKRIKNEMEMKWK